MAKKYRLSDYQTGLLKEAITECLAKKRNELAILEQEHWRETEMEEMDIDELKNLYHIFER